MRPLSVRRETALQFGIRGVLASGLTLLLALVGSGVLVVLAAAPGEAAITAPFVQVFSASTAGGIQIRGNTMLSCLDSASACADARAESLAINNDYFMDYVDIDGDGSTFDSSASTVDIPVGGSVLFAALTWGGDTKAGANSGPGPEFGSGTAAVAPNATNKDRVRFKVPGSATYVPVTSTRTSVIPAIAGTYQGYADVTAAVRAAGNGQYTVADLQAGKGTKVYGGWALTIAYSDPAAPPRNLTIFSGFGSVIAGDSVEIPVSGFLTPPGGPVHTTLGAVSYEGDANLVGDQLLLGNDSASVQDVTDDLHPGGDTLDSVISDNGVDSSSRTPKYTNQLGFDAATFSVDDFLANDSTTAVIRLTSTGDSYYPGVVTFATDLAIPSLTATKAVTIAAKGAGNFQPVVEAGDTLEYTVDVANDGPDASIRTVLRDTMPAGTAYVPGSLTTGGVPLTDATGDDVGSYDAGGEQITVHLGTGATPVAGGRIPVASSADPVRFRVVVDSGSANGASITNTADLAYEGDQTGIVLAGSSNPVPSTVQGHHSALWLTKTADVARVQRGSSTPVTYLLTVRNTGPYADPGVRVTDALPAGAVVLATTPSSGTCTSAPGEVACALGLVPNGATATVAVRVRLDAASDPAPDTASVTGTNIDSDPADNTASLSTAVNTPPVAIADAGTTSGGTVTLPVLANDSDPDGDPLTASPGTAATKGSYVVNPDQSLTYTATPGAAGTDTFSYVVLDDRDGATTANVTVTIPNALPVANDDAAATLPGQVATVPVLANDTDPNIPGSGQVLSVLSVTQPVGDEGVVAIAGTKVTFTPAGTFRTGSTTFGYTVSDGAGGTATATVTVSVPNVGPVAVDDDASTAYLTPLTVDVHANDLDDNGDPLVVTGVTGSSHGSTTITATGVLYTPDAGWSGPDSMSYTVSDGAATDTAVLSVTTANAPPIAGDLNAAIGGGVPATIVVLGQASDPNGDPLTVIGTGAATHGTVRVDVDDAIVYTPNPTYAGPDTLTYTVSDGRGGTATGTVTITVDNQPPTARDDDAVVPGGGFVDVPVLDNDTDPNGDPLTITAIGAPSDGVVELGPGGTVRYRPNSGYLGTDTFTYLIDDGHGGSDEATVTVTVANQAPVAIDATATAGADAGSPIDIDVLANDTDPNNDPLTIVSTAPPAHGTAAVVGGQIHYTPNASFAGFDVFTYTIRDGRGGFAIATVTVEVRNRLPVANPDSHPASTGMVTTIDVVANDTDLDNEGLTLASADASSTAGGVVSVIGGLPRYRSATGFTGTDTYRYVVTDPRGGTATGVVTVLVTNASPLVPGRDLVTGTNTAADVNLLASVIDADGQPLSVAPPSHPDHGTATVGSSGIGTYTPERGYAGPDAFSYTVLDGQGGSGTATVDVTVTNAAPVAVDDVRSGTYGTAVTADVLTNDTDANIPGTSQVLTLLTATKVSGGATVAPSVVDGTVLVTPDDTFAGDVVVGYVVSDGYGGTGTGRLTVHVGAPAATAAADHASTPGGTPVLIDVLANDSSGTSGAKALVDGSVTTPVDVDGVPRGTVTVVGTALRYAPQDGFAGTVTFRYAMSNSLGGTDTSTVTVTVADLAPNATDDAGTTPYDSTVSVDVLLNDTDANIPVTDQLLAVGWVQLVSGRATVTISSAGTVRVNPDADFAGEVVVDYGLSDGAGGADTGRLTVQVAAPEASALDDSASTSYDTSVRVDVLANDSSGQVDVEPTLVAASLTDAVDSDGTVQGSVSVDHGQLRYAPRVGGALALADAPRLAGVPAPTGFSGTVTFDYAVTNPLGATDIATVTVIVEPEGVANPIATPAPATTRLAVTVATGTLAQTGADPGAASAVALLLMGLGSGAVWLRRSRRHGRPE